MKLDVNGYFLSNNRPYTNATAVDNTIATYLQYTAGNFTFAGEYRKQPRNSISNLANGAPSLTYKNARQGYVSAAYRGSRRVELGAYHSRIVRDWLAYHGDPKNHVFDQAITARLDLKSFLDFKIEGHFIDGADIDSVMSHGFFAASNPDGLKPQMAMLVMRLGFHF